MSSLELKKIKENLLSLSKKINKKYDYQFSIGLAEGVTVTSRCGNVESIEHNQDNVLGVKVLYENRQGFAGTNNLSNESIEKTIEKAKNIATNTQPDNCNGLPDSNFVTSDNMPKLNMYYPSDVGIKEIIDITHECEKSAFEYDKRINNSEGSSFSYTNNNTLIINSNGADGMKQTTSFTLSCIVVAEDGKSKERDYEYSAARDFKKLESPEKVGTQAGQKTISRLGARTIKTRVCPVLFSPEMSVSIFSDFLSAIQGSAIYRRASFLLDKIDQPIFPDFISISEEPHLPDGIGSSPFDAEGVLTKNKSIVSDGKLKSYLLDTYSARKLGSTSTSNKSLVTNIIVDTKKEKIKNIISNMPDGIYITEMMGSGVNIITGDYSRGAFGYLIKDGEISHPVTEITVASNLKDMFKNIIGLGSDIDRRSNINIGSLLINNITIGGAN
ncbi:MAG: metallopeptidase TldD-related protein [Pseudomonadota bacterium]|nr:metallopeptidase TldD-related protein [Pseudomonadota bacterium]